MRNMMSPPTSQPSTFGAVLHHVKSIGTLRHQRHQHYMKLVILCLRIHCLSSTRKSKNRIGINLSMMVFGPFLGDENRTRFFFKFFGHSQDIPAKIPGYPAKKFGFPGFLRRTYRIFWPSPLHVEDPHPTQRHPDQNIWVWFFFFPEFQCSVRSHTMTLKPAFEFEFPQVHFLRRKPIRSSETTGINKAGLVFRGQFSKQSGDRPGFVVGFALAAGLLALVKDLAKCMLHRLRHQIIPRQLGSATMLNYLRPHFVHKRLVGSIKEQFTNTKLIPYDVVLALSQLPS